MTIEGNIRRAAMTLFCAALAISTAVAQEKGPPTSKPGILLLAHGGSEAWNDNVRALAARVNQDQPVEIAFGMATRANIQRAVDTLAARGVDRIVAVPLFVSSHSSVVTSTEYLLGLRPDAPADLAAFAKMNHGSHGGGATNGGHDHGAASTDGTQPVTTVLPVRMSGALDAHPIVASIVVDRARGISSEPSREAVVLVAHGPVRDAENDKWLANMRVLAGAVQQSGAYASVDCLTVRDDAPPAIKEAATTELRALVASRRQAGSRVLVVPVLLSFGGIEQGIRKRLDGLDYTMASQAIMPDDRLALWIKEQAAAR